MLWLSLLLAMTEAQFEAARKHAPPDVRGVVDRWGGCNHWAGEEPYDKDREREILSASKRLRCHRLEKDDATLRRKYRANRALIRLLDQAKEWD